MANWEVAFTFRDNEGKKGQARCFRPEAASFGAVASWALTLAPTMQALSLAVLEAITITKRTATPELGPAQPGSDTRSYLVLFYGNPSRAAALVVPSPGGVPADVVGPYRNVRLDVSAPGVSLLLSELGDNLSGTVAPDGDPWPFPFLTGGFTRYEG